MKNKEHKSNEKELIIKFLLCFAYLIIITILFVCSYKLYKEKDEVKPWELIKTADDYSYIKISQMSEAFASYEKENKQIHFVIEKEDTGLWHTYLIAIHSSDYEQYKDIIDYTYKRTDKIPEAIKVYGYPVVIDNNLKQLTIKNISNFVPKENEVKITDENFKNYLTNSYLDTTIKRKDTFSFYLFVTFLLMIIMILLFVFTLFYKEGSIKKIHNKLKKNSENKFRSNTSYKLVRK